jgi:hypothetical protein
MRDSGDSDWNGWYRRSTVVPGRAADAGAVALLEDNVELRQQVETFGDEVTLVKAVCAFIGQSRVADLGIAPFDSRGQVHPDVVVPADRQVGIARVSSKACAPLLSSAKRAAYSKD